MEWLQHTSFLVTGMVIIRLHSDGTLELGEEHSPFQAGFVKECLKEVATHVRDD